MKIHKVQLDAKTIVISQRGNLFKVIKPYRNDDGSLNWFNILTGGSWLNLLVVGFLLFVILGLLSEYSSNIKMLQAAVESCNTIIMP